MESRSGWYKDIAKQIERHRDNLNEKRRKKYKLDMLLCLAQRIDSFSIECSDCQAFKGKISTLVKNLDEFNQMPADSAKLPEQIHKSYHKTMNTIIKHLQKSHKLITEGQNVGLWMSIGMALGIGIGSAMDKSGAGLPIGIGLGMAIGSYLDNKAKKEGRIICPKEKTTRKSKSISTIMIIIGVLVLVALIGYILYSRASNGS